MPTWCSKQIADLVAGKDLPADDAAGVMESIMTGEATPAQFGAFVTALRIKGETAEEIAGMARVMRDKALRVNVDGDLVDTCGTGGDGTHSINISTIAALVAVGAEAPRRPTRQPRHHQRVRQRRRA